MTHRAEIISIGDELTSGQRLDTNSKWISERLGELGVKTVFHTTVGDSMTDNVDAFRTAARRADIVIASGGLGPTADDLTREAMAIAFDAPLELRNEALVHIESLFAMRKRPMPERNRSQAMFPKDSRIIDNPHGTAPGIDLVPASRFCAQDRSSRIFALPGVPAEMMQMFLSTVQVRLKEELGVGQKRWFFYCIKVFGIGESDVEKMIPDLIARERDPVVGITVSKATITLRIAALCSTEEEFQAKIQPTVAEIHDKLGTLVFAEGEIDLDEATHLLLTQQNKTLGLIEIGSGAWIQSSLAPFSMQGASGLQVSSWLPSIAHIKALLPEGFAAERQDRPESVVDEATIQLSNMAELVRAHHKLDLCLAVGTYPTLASVGSTKSIPTCDFTIALARRDRSVKHTRVTLGAHPDVLFHRLAKASLNFMRIELLQDD